MNQNDYDNIALIFKKHTPFLQDGAEIEDLVSDICELFSNDMNFNKEKFISDIGNDKAISIYLNR